MKPPEFRFLRPATTSFHARIMAAALVTSLGVLLIAGLAFMGQQWAMVHTQNRNLQATLGAMAATNIADAVQAGDDQAVSASIRALRVSPILLSAEYVDTAGHRVASFHRHGDEAAGAMLVLRTPVVRQGQKFGEVVTMGRRAGLSDVAPQLLALAGALLFAGIAAAMVMARVQADRVVAPVLELSAAMKRVSESGGYDPIVLKTRFALFRGLGAVFN
ncbi:MAG: hypothetical protein IM666_13020, partial [Phenylobacterium sp.]|nr:hypothetical protein [Phenylobacterium sp.]